MVFLVDNGSVRIDAYLNLCRIAEAVSQLIGEEVSPAPLLHGNKIPAEKLNGQIVKILEEQLSKAIGQGINSFTILPLFFGESGALIDYLPRRLIKLAEKHPTLRVKFLSPLYRSKSNGGDILAEILRDQVVHTVESQGLKKTNVVLVDHGSPSQEVTKVRNELAVLLKQNLSKYGTEVSPASMERRSGTDYEFNEPLLERILRQAPFHSGAVVIAQLFLSPGRHAGPHGDLASICEEAEKENPDLKTYRTELVGSHPLLIDLLVRRWNEGRRLPFKLLNT
jgi:sirohydrochlorin ferrochelatase